MAKKFTGNSPARGSSINPTIAQPLDIRQVVQYYSDLSAMDNETISYTYVGMIVAVVEDQDSSKNGVYYKKSTAFSGPDAYKNWEKIGSGSVVGGEFVFTVDPTFIEIGENQYQEAPAISSDSEMTLTSTYSVGSGSGDGRIADVIAVRESEARFHLMLNPELLYVLDGGTSNSSYLSVNNITRTTATVNE